MRTQLLIPAAGMGARLGPGTPKAMVQLRGQALIVRTLARLADASIPDPAIVVAPSGYEVRFAEVLKGAFPDRSFTYVTGGNERQDSVRFGLNALEPDTEVVVIHDAARPFATLEAVEESIRAAERWGAATVAVPSVDTILVADSDGFLTETPERQHLWACQTPQAFQAAVIREAHQAATKEKLQATDDATLVRRWGGVVKLVEGSPLNFKITTPANLAMAEAIIDKGLA